MLSCPVCSKEFYTKNSLANHIIKNKSLRHKKYYINNMKKRVCPTCGKSLDYRVKLYNGVCFGCFNKRNKNKKVNKKFLSKTCFKCGASVEGYFSPKNTRVLCPECKKESLESKAKYNERYDKIRYRVLKDKRVKERQYKKERIKEDLYFLLKEDVLDFSIPIYKILKKYSISLKYFNYAAKSILTEEELRRRKHVTRSVAAQKMAIKHKERWKKDPWFKLDFKRNVPNKLEQKLIDDIYRVFPGCRVSSNIWKSIKNKKTEDIIRTEIDIRFLCDSLKIYILCDGEAFHGSNCYFRGDTVELDEERSRALFSIHPYVLRYSETEIKTGEAVKHLYGVFNNIKANKLSSFYRNWMIPDCL